jgi:hypothetical protein
MTTIDIRHAIGAAGAGLVEGWLTEEFFEPLPEDELAVWQQ